MFKNKFKDQNQWIGYKFLDKLSSVNMANKNNGPWTIFRPARRNIKSVKARSCGWEKHKKRDHFFHVEVKKFEDAAWILNSAKFAIFLSELMPRFFFEKNGSKRFSPCRNCPEIKLFLFSLSELSFENETEGSFFIDISFFPLPDSVGKLGIPCVTSCDLGKWPRVTSQEEKILVSLSQKSEKKGGKKRDRSQKWKEEFGKKKSSGSEINRSTFSNFRSQKIFIRQLNRISSNFTAKCAQWLSKNRPQFFLNLSKKSVPDWQDQMAQK